jgi:large subunit ribosomal protein L29
MALLRTKDLRAMRPEDLRAKLKEINDELMHERGVAAMGGAPASPGKIRALRSNVARMHTIILEQDRASGAVPAKYHKKTKGKQEKKSVGKKEEKK